MNWFVQMMSSTIGRKLLMALTGLFLILFLVVHLSGNLLLLKGDSGEAFNTYAHFMGNNPLIKFISIGNFSFILLHIVYAVLLTIQNKKARPIGYAVESTKTSKWNSRNMGILGTVILIFLVVHLQNFWFQMKFGYVPVDAFNNKDLYTVTKEAFGQWWLVSLYVVSMVFLALHLSHGFASAFQTLGLNHRKYTPLIQFIGLAFSIVVPAGFASIPLIMFFSQL
jgi:succinate dehydrogenase / fumarate reductase cytochrome b subunit